MADDAIDRIAKLRIIKASADLEVQIAMRSGSAPTLLILRELRKRAAESLAGLAFVNLHDPKGFIEAVTLQNEVKRYDEWVVWMQELISRGKEFDQEISAEDREDLLDTLVQTPEGQQEAINLGLIEQAPQD